MSKPEKQTDKLATTDQSLARLDEPLALGRSKAKAGSKSTVANLQRDIAALISEMAEQLADAKVAEMLLRQKNAPKKHGNSE